MTRTIIVSLQDYTGATLRREEFDLTKDEYDRIFTRNAPQQGCVVVSFQRTETISVVTMPDRS